MFSVPPGKRISPSAQGRGGRASSPAGSATYRRFDSLAVDRAGNFAVDNGLYKLPLPADQGLGLGKPLKSTIHPRRAEIPNWQVRPGRELLRDQALHGSGRHDQLPGMHHHRNHHDAAATPRPRSTRRRVRPGRSANT